jgi:hypothetical protein
VDARGQLVHAASAYGAYRWDTRAALNGTVPSGVYYATLTFGGHTLTIPVVIVR